MFLRQHAGGQSVLGIARQDRHPRLAEDRAGIKLGRHLMHGAARLGVARRQRAGMGVQAGILRQKRGVDVQHPALQSGATKSGRQDAHEAGKAEDVGLGRMRSAAASAASNAARSLPKAR